MAKDIYNELRNRNIFPFPNLKFKKGAQSPLPMTSEWAYRTSFVCSVKGHPYYIHQKGGKDGSKPNQDTDKSSKIKDDSSHPSKKSKSISKSLKSSKSKSKTLKTESWIIFSRCSKRYAKEKFQDLPPSMHMENLSH